MSHSLAQACGASELCWIDLPSQRFLSQNSSARVFRWIDLPSPRSLSRISKLCQCSPCDRLSLATLDDTEQRSQCAPPKNRSAFDKSPGSSGSVEDTVQRNRKDAPPRSPLRKRGSEQVAFDIARSPHLVDDALSDCRRLTYAPGSLAAKSSGKPCGKDCVPNWAISPDWQATAVPTGTYAKSNNHNTGGFWKTFPSLNPRCWHCRTPKGRTIGCWVRRREPKKYVWICGTGCSSKSTHVKLVLHSPGEDESPGFCDEFLADSVLWSVEWNVRRLMSKKPWWSLKVYLAWNPRLDVDALSVSLPPTSSAKVTALDLDQIKGDADEHSFAHD